MTLRELEDLHASNARLLASSSSSHSESSWARRTMAEQSEVEERGELEVRDHERRQDKGAPFVPLDSFETVDARVLAYRSLFHHCRANDIPLQ